MPKLRTLGVNLRNVDERGLARLASFPALRDLTPIGLGDRGFAHVGKCTSLEKLVCMYTDDIGDGAIECLGGLEHLRRFYAGETSITDRGLEVLAALPALEEVELWDCPSVTNAGLAALAQAPRLRVVKLEGLPYATRAAATLFPPDVEVRISS